MLHTLTLLLPIVGILFAVFVGMRVWTERRTQHIVECGLYTEAIALRWQASAVAAEIARRHNAAEPFNAEFFDLWPLSKPLVYCGTGAESLGYLSRADRARVTFFHAQLEGARQRWTSARNVGAFEPSPYRVLSGIVRAYYEIDPWILRLKPILGEFPEQEPALDGANDLVAKFETTATEPHVAAYCAVDCAFPADDTIS